MKTDEMTQRRRLAHHAALETLAREVGCLEPGLKLWRKLRRLEAKVYAACEAYSNDSNFGLARWEMAKGEARAELARIFWGKIPSGVFINGDPRGHMLKLDNEERTVPEGMHTDMGQYGILAAEINPED